MLEQDFKDFLKQNQLLLPKQPSHDDFLQAMEKVFQISCIFGVFGTRRINAFVWTIFILCSLIYIEGNAVWKVVKALLGWAADTEGHRSIAARFAGTIFYSISIISLVLASKFFYFWPDLATAWAKVERTISLKVPVDRTLKMRIYNTAALWLFCSGLEHFMSMIAQVGLDCPHDQILKRYILYSHGFMILNKDYAEWYAIPLAISNFIATFLWNFQDILIVLISIGLTSRYRRLNQCLASVCAADKKQIEYNKKTESAKLYTWRRLREAYVKQALLVRRVDSALGGIIVLSCVCNFYFICLQLFMGITLASSNAPIKNVYYVVSLIWLCIRVTSVVLTASDINIHSQLALKDIYTYDTHGYNVEVDRLQDQLSKDYIALSGMGFFYLNKTVLLQMAGAIITYELVLIQFDNKEAVSPESLQLNITNP